MMLEIPKIKKQNIVISPHLCGHIKEIQNMSLKMSMIAKSICTVPGIYVFMQINWGCKIKVQVKTPIYTLHLLKSSIF